MKFFSVIAFSLASLLLCSADAKSTGNSSHSQVSTIENRMLTDLNGSANETLGHVPTTQERLDMVVKALSRLPPHELERLGVSLTNEIIDGSPEADNLFRAWADRQSELKTAMKSLMQPAEFMTVLSATLRNATVPHSERRQALVDLESLVGDIDNARDFHTIGSWPLLVNLLNRCAYVAFHCLIHTLY